MSTEVWQRVVVAALALNASLGFGYRLHRLTKGGPLGDVVGQAALGALLALLAAAVAAGSDWGRWAALAYGALFGVVVMPLWTLAVLLPLRPKVTDYAFAVVYWTALGIIVVGAVMM